MTDWKNGDRFSVNIQGTIDHIWHDGQVNVKFDGLNDSIELFKDDLDVIATRIAPPLPTAVGSVARHKEYFHTWVRSSTGWRGVESGLAALPLETYGRDAIEVLFDAGSTK